jgi:hypothetical protein
MSTDQEYWDACLIKTWRKADTVTGIFVLFKSVTGKRVDECDPPLIRVPPLKFPWNVGVRVFVADYLSKISERLWNQPPEKDVLLLRKLKDSKYDTSKSKEGVPDKELNNERGMLHRNQKRVGMSTLEASNRNQPTDWNIVKGPAKIQRKR